MQRLCVVDSYLIPRLTVNPVFYIFVYMRCIDFYATWCRPCKLISPVFAELSKSYPDIKFGKVNVEKVQDGQVLKVPTFKFYSDGGKELSQSVTGMNPDNLKLCVKKFAEDNLT